MARVLWPLIFMSRGFSANHIPYGLAAQIVKEQSMAARRGCDRIPRSAKIRDRYLLPETSPSVKRASSSSLPAMQAASSFRVFSVRGTFQDVGAMTFARDTSSAPLTSKSNASAKTI
jgi:hypothetical protein